MSVEAHLLDECFVAMGAQMCAVGMQFYMPIIRGINEYNIQLATSKLWLCAAKQNEIILNIFILSLKF